MAKYLYNLGVLCLALCLLCCCNRLFKIGIIPCFTVITVFGFGLNLIGLGVVVLVLNQDGVTGTNPRLGWVYLNAGLDVVVEGVIFIEGEKMVLGARL